jgi:hypothetical protein
VIEPETALWLASREKIATRQKTCSGSDEPLCHDIPCRRCGLTDWAAFPERQAIVCGGCGFDLIDDVMEFLDIDESEPWP